MSIFHRLIARKREALFLAVASTVVLEILTVVSVYGFERASLWKAQSRITINPGPGQAWRPFEVPGIQRPMVVESQDATIPDDATVIGLQVGDKARAYRLDALRDRTRHIVNDLIDGVPVTVAYCDLTDCIRVYTGPRSSRPLDVAIAGLYEGEMVVKYEGVRYVHKSGRPLDSAEGATRLGLKELRPIRTQWKHWRNEHPKTDVYLGDAENHPGLAEASR